MWREAAERRGGGGGEDGEEGRRCEGGVEKVLRMQAMEGKFARQ